MSRPPWHVFLVTALGAMLIVGVGDLLGLPFGESLAVSVAFTVVLGLTYPRRSP